jgi:hypothetical protein
MMNIAATRIHINEVPDDNTDRIEPQDRLRVIKTTAAKKPKTTRQTTTSTGDAKDSIEMMIGNEPQIKYADNP